MVCDICGKEGARLRHMTRSYGKGDRLLVIENVPIISCPHCGESFQVPFDSDEGTAEFVVDCEICCRPMTVKVRVRDGEVEIEQVSPE